MTIEEAAKFLNMSTGAIRLLAEKGISHKRENGKMFVKASDISDWVNRQIRDFKPSEIEHLEKDFKDKPIAVSPFLDPKCVKLRVIGASKTAIIEELVDLLIEKGGVDPRHKATIKKTVIDRERMCSTALVDGIAIPHPREPLKGIIKKPRIVLGFSWHGVDFESMDGKPTHVIVLLCTPKLDIHLQLLARLTGLLRDSRLRVSLCRAKDGGEAVDIFSSHEKGKR